MLLDIGGAEANLSIALCRLGLSARFISRVGDDPFGQRMRATLEREGVEKFEASWQQLLETVHNELEAAK